ncbi:hypothetical protein LY78DRAFT_73826 [Colletotrichum sublineola]|nr:hypothetical protein LY78DRAFT_73826 [Colletotrichum sublineola]
MAEAPGLVLVGLGVCVRVCERDGGERESVIDENSDADERAFSNQAASCEGKRPSGEREGERERRYLACGGSPRGACIVLSRRLDEMSRKGGDEGRGPTEWYQKLRSMTAKKQENKKKKKKKPQTETPLVMEPSPFCQR